MGHILTTDEIKEAYQVDEVRYVDELVESLNSFTNPTLLRLDGVNSDSGNSTRRAAFDGKEFTAISALILILQHFTNPPKKVKTLDVIT